ncbi:MAG: response regulator transcription factor [Flavipsychrobacter sp.]|nr:response regulator transcription factor [Flavipsychrobacter sp.]
MEGNTILLVEDDFLNRRLTKKVLAENGYQVLEAKNAREALALLESNVSKVDLAILDIHLGEQGPDGIDVGKQIQERYGIPFLYLTAYDNHEFVNRAIATTPYSYITKPFKNIEILSTVMLAIRHSKKKDGGSGTITVKENEYNVELAIDEIHYIESDGNYLLFHTGAGGKVFRSRYTIKQLLEVLPRHIFVQTHRAFVVNRSKIEKFSSKSVVIGRAVVPVSRYYVEDVSLLPVS